MKKAKRFGDRGVKAGFYVPPGLRDKYGNPALRKSAASRPAGQPRAPKRSTPYDRQWRAFQRQYLAEHPWCVDCRPRLVIATEVHHIAKLADAPDLKYDPVNLMGLCKPCHARRTIRGE